MKIIGVFASIFPPTQASVLPEIPTLIENPTIAGVGEVGEVLTATPGVFVGSITNTYQWYRDSIAIIGATNLTYNVVEDDSDAEISFRHYAANPAGEIYGDSNSILIEHVEIFTTIFIENMFQYWNQRWTTTAGSTKLPAIGTFEIYVPTGYDCEWEILNKDQELVYSGQGTTVSTSLSDLGYYDLIVYIDNGVKQFNRRYNKIIFVLPPIFSESEADIVLNIASGGFVWWRDYAGQDFTGKRIYVKGTSSQGTSSLSLDNMVSSDPENPAHLLFDPNTTFNRNGECIRVGVGHKYVIYDAISLAQIAGVQYGCKLNSSNSRVQGFYVDPVGYIGGGNPTAANAGKSCWVFGFDFNGNDDAASFITVQTRNSANTNYSNYQYEDLYISACKSRNTVDEPIYLNRFTDAVVDGRRYAPGNHFRVWNCDFDESGADGFQVGLVHDFEAHNNIVGPNVALSNDSDHRNCVQINPGCRDAYFFSNIFLGGKNSMAIFMGGTGNNINIFSNLVQNHTTTQKINFFVRLDDNQISESSVILRIHDNNIELLEDVPFELWQVGSTTTFQPLIIADNLIKAQAASPLYTYPNGSSRYNASTKIYDNLQVTNASVFMQVDPTNLDCHLSSLSSTAFRGGQAFTKDYHYMSNRDFDGVERFEGCAIGPYSGYELFTQS